MKRWRAALPLGVLAILTVSVLGSPAARSAWNGSSNYGGSSAVDATVAADQSSGAITVSVNKTTDGLSEGARVGSPGSAADSCPGCEYAVFPASARNDSPPQKKSIGRLSMPR